ncbi:MAG TPA: polymer-forming cytoskeletal protein [Candidatus Angelobacter sp.]|nr:polymer-forming cytoskeletal protein [Candidatus Angelobacter sp.]
MWKPRPDEKPVSSNSPSQPTLAPPSAPAFGPGKETHSLEPAKASQPFRADVAAHIGKSVLVKGELSGSEDLYLDGEVEGTIELNNHTLVVGPNGRVRANISAREVIMHGKIEGNVIGTERVELKKSCVLSGDITTQRVVIEDGAFFKGSVDLQRESKAEPRKAVAAANGVSAAPVAVMSAQSSFSEHQ